MQIPKTGFQKVKAGGSLELENNKFTWVHFGVLLPLWKGKNFENGKICQKLVFSSFWHFLWVLGVEKNDFGVKNSIKYCKIAFQMQKLLKKFIFLIL